MNVCIPEAVDLHSRKVRQIATNDGCFLFMPPVNDIEGSSSLVFKFISDKNGVIDARNTYFAICGKIINDDGTDITKYEPDTDDGTINSRALVFPINSMGSSVIKNCEVSLNETPVTTSNNLYAYKAYMIKTLFCSQSEKEGMLSMSRFTSPNVPFEDHTELKADTRLHEGFYSEDAIAPLFANELSEGLTQRHLCSCFSKNFWSIDRIYEDVFLQKRYLPPRTTVKLVFTLNNSKFLLNTKIEAGQRFRFKVTSSMLIIRYVHLHRAIIRDMHWLTEKGDNFRLPLTTKSMIYHTRLAGSTELNHASIYCGRKPIRIVVGLVEQRAFFGSFLKDPFNFQHFNVQEVSITVNGSGRPLPSVKCDFDTDVNDFMMGLFSLTQVVGNRIDKGGCPNGIGKTGYTSGNVFFGFPLTATGDVSGENVEEDKKVNIDLNITLAKPSETGICVITYIEHDEELEVNKQRKVKLTSPGEEKDEHSGDTTIDGGK